MDSIYSALGSALDAPNPSTIKMAKAKVFASLYSAIAERAHDDPSIGYVEITSNFNAIAKDVAARLEFDTTDDRLMNDVRQALIPLAVSEIKKDGQLNGGWREGFVDSISELPSAYPVFSEHYEHRSSLQSTVSRHFCELICTTNTFAFLRNPSEVVTWAHELIDNIAHANAKQIDFSAEPTAAYQNQLNCLRHVFISCYEKEARDWLNAFEKRPQLQGLYPEGIPLSGIEKRFSECVHIFNKNLSLAQTEAEHETEHYDSPSR